MRVARRVTSTLFGSFGRTRSEDGKRHTAAVAKLALIQAERTYLTRVNRRAARAERRNDIMSVGASTSEESVDALRREAETTRANLTDTVTALRIQASDTADHLRRTVSPAAIKQQAKDYVRDSGESMLRSLQRRARENPLQTVAVGAALALPAWNMLRAVPAPLLLIGAGLALSRSDLVQRATADATDKLREGLEAAQHAFSATANDASETSASLRDQVSGAAKDMKASLAETAQSGMAQARTAVSTAGDKITSAADQATQQLTNTYGQNPLLIAGIGMVLGALVASALPATDTENRLFGNAAEKLRRRAVDEAADGLEAAERAASDIMDAATREGLSADGLSETAQDLTRKARKVVERGLEAAVGDAPKK